MTLRKKVLNYRGLYRLVEVTDSELSKARRDDGTDGETCYIVSCTCCIFTGRRLFEPHVGGSASNVGAVLYIMPTNIKI